MAIVAGSFTSNRVFTNALLCALLAGPFCLTARGQAAQAQSGSSGQDQKPADKTDQDKSQDKSKDKSKKKEPQKDQKQNQQNQNQQKKIKAHVIKAKEKAKDQDTTQSVEPDKVLYERAMLDVKKGRFTEGRLTLQALINTYPDSEYLAKAKLSVADSYYKEGGTSNLTQAIDEYKNFIIFFPFLDEAAYAQMQIGMGHFRMMEKSDRDTTQALEAEQEFQTFLLKFPQSPLIPKAEQYLRNAQEVLADGEYRIARFYFVKQDFAASAARLFEVTERYPLYSQSDEALWMLGDVYVRAKQLSKNEDDKNHWSDLAAKCYDRIVQNYPLSRLAPQAKARLTSMGMAVPAADPGAVARMQHEQLYQKQHRQAAVLRLPLGMLKSNPNVILAAHSGPPNLNPPNDAVSAREVLKQGAAGPDFDVQNRPADDQSQPADSGPPVEATRTSPNSAPRGGIGVQIISQGDDSNSQPANSQAPPSSSGTNPSTAAPASSAPPANPPAASTADPPPANAVAPTAAQGAAVTDPTASVGTASISGTNGQPPAQINGQANVQANTQANGQANGQAPGQAKAQAKDAAPAKSDKADPSTESSSKKKKGIKKIIPW